MTHDAEHTPSPQSVVVSDLAEIAPEMLPLTNEVMRSDGQHHAWSACVFFANHKAGDRPFASVSLDSRDASAYARDVARAALIADAVNSYAAAPAPSSLAGGEVREKVARIVDPETFDLITHYTGIERFDGLSPAEREPAVFEAYPDLKTARDEAFADADAILAALSPEAPAREGAEKALERALKSLRALQDGAATAMPAFEENEAVYDFLCAIHREAVKGQLASDDVTNEAALTPRHEAPASEGDAS